MRRDVAPPASGERPLPRPRTSATHRIIVAVVDVVVDAAERDGRRFRQFSPEGSRRGTSAGRKDALASAASAAASAASAAASAVAAAEDERRGDAEEDERQNDAHRPHTAHFSVPARKAGERARVSRPPCARA